MEASKTVLNRVAWAVTKELVKYISELERLGFSARHQDWEPRLLAVQDPVNNMKWSEVIVRRYRFKPE